MDNLVVSNIKMEEFLSNNSMNELKELYTRIKEYKNPSVTIIASMVYGFAFHLPYSMDIEQEEYVPGDFLNIEPVDVNENIWFKWSDRRTYYNTMLNGDAHKSGILLQVCYIFQQMLLGNISTCEITEKNFEKLANISQDDEYRGNFFEVLKRLPLYYQKVVSSKDNEERRHNLEEVYSEIEKNIGMRVGSFRRSEVDINGKVYVKEEYKPTILYPAWRDVELPIYFDRHTFFDGLELNLNKVIKAEQLEKYQALKNNPKLNKHL